MDLRSPNLLRILDAWIEEDLGDGDLTRFILNTRSSSAHWIAKECGTFCGGDIIKLIFQKIDPKVDIQLLIEDGQKFEKNQRLLELKGPSSSLVAGERVTLNLAMHLSGIATSTALLVNKLSGSNIKLADTRKTTPGIRIFEKYAFLCGGGINHRLGLYDAAMLKENHIEWSKGIAESIKVLKKTIPWTKKIIVEAETPSQAREAVEAGADGVLLDEMSIQTIAKLVPELRQLSKNNNSKYVSQNIVIEVSGINPNNLSDYISTGIDLISTSAPITKSKWIDFSMRFN
ncbi:carboxylating nicotinate-nucleotide diphosphorylase [Prochlorococcus marinus]|uniref:nicotinate-nucleotide diphosphorylase (carboxylating) n=1 Tax=Prochlorococcus marinus XMU1408 TaxID=2213228 RepID=A0A318RD24_PROMR|nr:carboxylating nicotinate-nucleotide diphosphorylase [Prochlorococcus marinus]MBW3041249.1 nicotinate-nucleotide diphosphorylase (carboxylating) [Prochlorococcus marinus str. XMU1408]PYE03838.1 carboxylating nicotinate-nucleotide diphosphorylase [Prochlorococcus marinus XMU1408]